MARVSRQLTEIKNEDLARWRVAIYIRLSREDGNVESYSVMNQRRILTQHIDECIQQGEDMIIYDCYVDDGYTGTDSKRDDFVRMLEDLKSKKANCVIVKDLSRLSRNYFEGGYYIESLFPSLDVRFISLDFNIDSVKNPSSLQNCSVAIMNVFNDDFCRQTSMKIRKVFDMKRKNGEFISSFAPYGYIKDPNNKNAFVIDEAAASIVREIFRLFISGESKMGIAKKLNDLSIPCPSVYKKANGMKYFNPHAQNMPLWSARSITIILKNQTYCGDMVQGKYRIKSYKVHTQIEVPKEEWFIVPNMHEPIIDRETFETVQNILKRDTRTCPTKKCIFLFGGLLRCADCGAAMSRSKKSNTKAFYYCRTFKDKSRLLCTNHSIREDNLSAAVLTAIQQQITLAISMSDMIREINHSPYVNRFSSSLDESLNAKIKELDKAMRYKSGLYRSYQDGDIDRGEYIHLRKEFSEEIEQLNGSIEAIESERRKISQGLEKQNSFLNHFMKYQNITELSREILVELIDTIFVHEGGKIVIKFRFADEYMRAAEFIQNNKRLLA